MTQSTTGTPDTTVAADMPGARRAVILLRVGDRSVRARQRFREMGRRLETRLEGTPVLTAYVAPGPAPGELTLSGAVERVVAGGATEVAVVPYEVEWDTGEWQDVPDTIQELARGHPQARFRLAQPLGVAPDDLVAALANRYAAAWSLPDVAAADVDQMVEIAAQPPIAQAQLRAGEAPQLPAHGKHVLVCLGRVCQQEGSAAIHDRLAALLDARGLAPEPGMHGLLGRARRTGDSADAGSADGAASRAIKVTRTKCLGPCAGAAVACVYPEGSFYWGLTADAVPRFVDDVLVGGGSLPGHTFRPGGAP